MSIPKGTTHVWTPAFDTPYVMWGYTFRRCAYKKMNGEWYSYSQYGKWVKSGNNPEWFDTERKEGYFVTINAFNKPGFVSKKEIV
jgi:hypothetical protein